MDIQVSFFVDTLSKTQHKMSAIASSLFFFLKAHLQIIALKTFYSNN